MLKTIDADQFRAGMYVSRIPGSWVRNPFWRSAFLADEDDVARLRASPVRKVVIDPARGLDVEDAAPAGADASVVPADPAPRPMAASRPRVERVPLDAEMARARRICETGRDAVAAMFREVRLGRTIDPDAALPLVEEITGSVLRHPLALISAARLKTADDYTYLHSVSVSALMATLARQLGLDADAVLEAAMGGLLHDMGKAAVPAEVLNKPASLTEDEMALMRRHPDRGHALLVESGVANAAVLDIARHHHEKFDGSGYPLRLAGEDISLLSRMAAVCDVYDAITSDRPYKKGWDAADALRRMASWSGHFDRNVFNAFVRSLGIYPVGTLVRLESDKLAVVVEQHPASLLTPLVRAFYSARTRTQLLLHDIDLAAAGCADRIVAVESPRDWGFRNLDRLWMP